MPYTELLRIVVSGDPTNEKRDERGEREVMDGRRLLIGLDREEHTCEVSSHDCWLKTGPGGTAPRWICRLRAGGGLESVKLELGARWTNKLLEDGLDVMGIEWLVATLNWIQRCE
jgi:hypothetical protein